MGSRFRNLLVLWAGVAFIATPTSGSPSASATSARPLVGEVLLASASGTKSVKAKFKKAKKKKVKAAKIKQKRRKKKVKGPSGRCDHYEPKRQPFFGDLHVHTSSSLDADLQGTRLPPDGAYDFARGATVDIQPFDANGVGQRTLSIDRPLDFAMVSDHAEFFGEISICRTPGLPGHDSLTCLQYRNNPELAFININVGLSADESNVSRLADLCGPDGQICVDESITLWTEIQQAAENAYDRSPACTFTSFVGYEWTGAPRSKNLHRNVVFRNQFVPSMLPTYFEAPFIEDLWDALDADCSLAIPGCEFLTIPHNSNLSQGRYFRPVDRDGNPYDATVAARRELMEPLIEVMQHKGQSECIPESSPADELCNFEVLPYNNLSQPVIGITAPPLPRDFVREAYKRGLGLEESLGANPYKHGMIGSTDTHIATPGAASEVDYPGHGGAGAPAQSEIPPGLVDLADFNPGGLAVIWAEENTRDSLFDAMRRKETYGTSGTRPRVRFFGSYDYPADLCTLQNRIGIAYDGTPMGSDLPSATAGQSPRFLVSALKDPGTLSRPGTDLQRIQIIKGWIDANGDPQELVYDVAGDPNNGASVDVATCQPTGTGFADLCTVWTDPAFDPSQRAFYYARVLENPTCRWTRLQCNAGGVDCGDPASITEGFERCCDGTLPDTLQERAWTSPIWHSPAPAGP